MFIVQHNDFGYDTLLFYTLCISKKKRLKFVSLFISHQLFAPEITDSMFDFYNLRNAELDLGSCV